jgi:hypothetical protein
MEKQANNEWCPTDKETSSEQTYNLEIEDVNFSENI